MTGFNRREFIATTAAAGVGAWALGREQREARAEEAKGKSIVVSITRDDATKEKKPNAPAVKEMVNAVVCKLSGKTKPEEAWSTYIKKDDVVAIKINCLFGVTACTWPEVTAAVVEGCKMAGVPDDKIIVWDRSSKDLQKCGYTPSAGPGVRTVGVDGAWEDEPTAIATCQGKMAKILTRECTALINLPILKTHSISGITMSMKNHYGSFDCPNKAHANGCDPFIAELNALDCIRKKTRLIVADALLPLPDRGPQAHPELTWAYNTIMASLDTVAIDYVGIKILDEQRGKLSLPPIEPKCKCVQTAAAKGLGAADMSKIEIVKV
jgi:uncharacterized protein (DUF362 family)